MFKSHFQSLPSKRRSPLPKEPRSMPICRFDALPRNAWLKFIAVSFFTLSSTIAGAAAADQLPKHTLQEQQPSVLPNLKKLSILNNRSTPWSAVGHVNVAGYRRRGSCSGTLIASDLVLTAAHCVFNKFRGKPHRPENIHFLTGPKRGEYIEHGKAKCVLMHGYPEAVKHGATTANALARDIALVVLNEPLSTQPLPVMTNSKEVLPKKLIHVSYPKIRRHLLSADLDCRLTSKSEKLWRTNCATAKGSSGGPVIQKNDQTHQVVAVMVAIAKNNSSIAVPISPLLDRLTRKRCPDSGPD